MAVKKKKKNSDLYVIASIVFSVLLIGVLAVSGVLNNFPDGLFAAFNINPGSSITVNTSQVIAPVNPRFQGLSIETSNLCNLVGAWDTPTFEQMFKNFGPQVIRIGGNSVEVTVWEPNGTASCSSTKTVLTKALIDSFLNFAQRINAKVMWTINMGSNNPTMFAQEAAYVVSKAKEIGGSNGSLLLSLGIGNEPDLYVNNGKRASTYTVANYVSEWTNYKNAIIAAIGQSDFKFMANDNCCNDKWFDGVIDSQRSAMSLISHHYYPTRSTETGIRIATIENLLSPTLMRSTINDYIDKWVAKSGALPLTINETNSTAGGGLKGLSDTFAATLWGIDYTFTTMERGVDYLTFHTGTSPSIYSPLQRVGGTNWVPNSLYYSMLTSDYVAPNGGNLVSTTVSSSYNVTAHSVLDNGTLRVVIINKDLTNNATISINTDKTYATSNFFSLTAPSLTETTNISLAENKVNTDGTWMSVIRKLLKRKGQVVVNVPAASAAIIVLK